MPLWGHECADSVPREGCPLWPCTVLVDSKQCVSLSLHMRIRPAGEARRVEPAPCQRSGQKTLQASAQARLSSVSSPRPKEAGGSPACSVPVRVTRWLPGAPSCSGSQQGGGQSMCQLVRGFALLVRFSYFTCSVLLWASILSPLSAKSQVEPFRAAAVVTEEAQSERCHHSGRAPPPTPRASRRCFT